MGKIAFMLSGQGSQAAGMGLSLAESCPKCLELLKEADRALRIPVTRLLTDGASDDLRLTRNAQPTLLALSVAQAKHLLSMGVPPAIL